MNSQSKRWGQFGLRTLLIFVTLAAIGTCAGHRWYRWWSTRPVHLVERWYELTDEEKFKEAEGVADTMSRLHPGEVADTMVFCSRVSRDFSEGTTASELRTKYPGYTYLLDE